ACRPMPGGRSGAGPPPPASPWSAEAPPRAYGGIPFGGVGEHAALPPRPEPGEDAQSAPAADTKTAGGGPLRLLRYRPLFAGPAVERVPELHFPPPDAPIELAAPPPSPRPPPPPH